MGLIVSVVKKLIKLLVYFLIFAALVVLIPNLPPYTTFSSIELDQSQPRVGPLAPNNALNNAKQVYKGKLLGPETFELFNGEVYTSLATGEIVKLSSGGHVTFVTKVGQPCTGLTQEHICGRPLGLQIVEKTNMLYLADAYHGIWKVNLKTDQKQLLVSPNVPIDGKLPKLFNSLVVAKNGDIYWTDSSTDFNLKDGAIAVLTDPTGRFLHYNALKNESKVLLDNLWFANGLAISPDNDFILISESNKYRVIKYFIAGPNKGKSEVVVKGLPGAPDNLRALPDGSGVVIALYSVFDEYNPLLTRSMAETPLVRKFLARLMRLIEIPFEYLHNLYPHIVFEEIIYYIGHIQSVSRLAPKMSGLVQMDWNGNIIASYYNTDGTLGHICDAIVYGDKLYTGNPHGQDFIGTVNAPPLLLKAFTNKRQENIPKNTARETQQKAQPIQREPHIVETPKVVKPINKNPPKQESVEKPAVVTEKPIEKSKPITEKPIEKLKPVTNKPVVMPKTVTEKPNANPKVVTEKPVEQTKTQSEKIKPVTEKPIEKVKPVTDKPIEKVKPVTDKPIEKVKSVTDKPIEKVKPVTDKTTEKPVEKKVTTTTSKPVTQTSTTAQPPKVEPKVSAAEHKKVNPPPNSSPPSTSLPSKNAETQSTTPKSTESTNTNTKPVKDNNQPPKAPKNEKPETLQKPAKAKQVKNNVKVTPEQIPIKEEIPSDIPKPTNDKLKVIKKGGPTEIPNINKV